MEKATNHTIEICAEEKYHSIRFKKKLIKFLS